MRPRFIVLQSPLPDPVQGHPCYEVYDRHNGYFVLGRWSYRAQAQQHADECNARDKETPCA